MLIRAGYTISFTTTRPTPMLAALSIHPSRHRDLRTAQRIMTVPDLPLYDYIDGYGNICSRLVLPEGDTTISCGFVIEDPFELDVVPVAARQVPIERLPDDVLVYLLASRYCETDRLTEIAWSLFGHMTPGWSMVQEIVAFVHNRITFDYGKASPGKSALDVFVEERGVCRDFAHLSITLCRCMNVPARYCSGYLGDMDLPAPIGDMDFSAWFEAYLDGQWFTFDARHNRPRRGRILMSRGRDATDAALTTSFGDANLTRFEVYTDENLAGIPAPD